MGLLSSLNRSAKYLFYVLDVFTKYAWVKPLEDEKSKTSLHGFIKIVNESERKSNKLWVDQEKDFYNSFIQKWWDYNDILMHSIRNEGKSEVGERLVKNFKNKSIQKWQLNILSWLLI